MKNDKTKLKNWVDGDTFAVKIENQTDEYNGRYLILTKKNCPLEDCGENYYFPYCYIKITNESHLPTTEEEINQLETIKCDVKYYDKKTIDYMHKGGNCESCVPDEYNYIYPYLIGVDFYKKNKDLDNFIYLGNYNIQSQKNEIFSYPTSYICVTTKFDWIGELIEKYKNYNLHQGWEFQPGGLDRMKEAYFRDYNARIMAKYLIKKITNFTPEYSFGWGVGIYDSDLALDVKGSYADVYKKNKSYEEIMSELNKTIGDYLSDELDGPISWIVIADQEMKRKRLNSELKNVAYECIEKDLKNWENHELYEKRKKVMDKFRDKLDNFE